MYTFVIQFRRWLQSMTFTLIFACYCSSYALFLPLTHTLARIHPHFFLLKMPFLCECRASMLMYLTMFGTNRKRWAISLVMWKRIDAHEIRAKVREREKVHTYILCCGIVASIVSGHSCLVHFLLQHLTCSLRACFVTDPTFFFILSTVFAVYRKVLHGKFGAGREIRNEKETWQWRQQKTHTSEEIRKKYNGMKNQ